MHQRDVTLLANLIEDDDEPESPDEKLRFSDNLNTHIITSEIIGGKSLEQAREESETYFASLDETLSQYKSRDEINWPVYPADQYTHKWAETDLPMLIINGNMDPATPLALAQRVKDHFKGSNRYLVALPSTPHGALFLSQLKDVSFEDVDTCGSRLLFGFVGDVTVKPDTSCIADMIQPDFSGTSEVAEKAVKSTFGTDSVWD